jgi:radical SAM protein with 4Fe4S-binding SPASM domain
MLIETDTSIYETFFHHAQIEITGCCNMNCEHCRANMEKKIFMPLDKIEKILQFAKKNMGEEFNLTLSGGEPFLHPNLIEIVRMGVDSGYSEIVITTNGSLVTDEIVNEINKFSDGKVTIQISIDSVAAKTHDTFRGYEGAFDKAIRGLEIIKKYKYVNSSIRMTVKRETQNEMEEMIKLAIEKGCIRIGIGNIIPAGLGADSKFVIAPSQKKEFLENLSVMNRKYSEFIDVTTEDPLKSVIEDSPWIDEEILEIESVDGIFGGCTAGIDCFNVDTEYNFTPCSVFREKIINLNDHDSISDLETAYANSRVVKEMCSRVFEGKCNSCRHKRICGGCRATASFFGDGDYFCSDGTCWI